MDEATGTTAVQTPCLNDNPSVLFSLQVKRKLDLDSDHQYVSTTRPPTGQAPLSTPAPPRGINLHRVYSDRQTGWLWLQGAVT